jgi:PAS domain S-box-containing protein
MKPNKQSNWQDLPQDKAYLRRSKSIKSGSKKIHSKNVQFLYQNRAELQGLSILYESLPCICFTLNLKGKVLSISQFGSASLGYDALELVQKPVASIFYLEDQTTCEAGLSNLQHQSTQMSEWEARLICKNGDMRWVRARACLAPETQSNPIIILVCEQISVPKPIEDKRRDSDELHRSMLTPTEQEKSLRITEEKLERSLEELRWKEALLKAMTSTSPLAFYVMDNRTDAILYFNHRFCEIWGIEHLEEQMQRGELKNSDISSACLPLLENVEAFAESCKPLKCGENSAVVEDEISFIDGRTIRHFSSQIQDESDHYFGRLSIFKDITERKNAQEALQQQVLKERLVGAIAQRIHESLNLEEILNTTVAEVRQFLTCDRVIIFRLHPDGSGVVVVESVGSEWKRISGTIINDRYFAESYVQLYQQGRVQAVEDIYTAKLAPCHVELLAQFQVRANLVVPIVHEEKLWGLLVTQQCGEARQWQSLEIDLLKSLATQAAIAIQQSELYQYSQTEIIQRQQAEAALQQQFQRERLIGAIAGRIRKSLKLEKILESTVAEVRQVLQTDRVVIFRFEPDWSGKIVVESVDNPQLSILGQKIYDPCFKQVYILPYQQGRVKAIEDIYTANLNECHINLLTQFQVRANLVVPILKQEQLWGLLIAHHCSEPRQWQQFEIDLLTSLASQAAIAIQQSQLYEQAKSQAKREKALNQVTQVIRSSLDLNTIFSTATREISELLQVDRVQILQYLPERKLWVSLAESCKCLCSSVETRLEITDEHNEITEKLKRLDVVRIDNTNSLEGEINQDVAKPLPGAWLLVPLRSGASVWGALGLVMDVGPYHWQDSQVELSCEVADQLAIALQQAELYDQSRTAAATALTQAQQLELALQELQKTQAQLVQSEKMSSLGQLVAGVAHEINNPVSFIYGNLIHAHGYTQDLLDLIQFYQQYYPNPTPEVQSKIETIDLDFLIEDLPKLLDSMKFGAERICEIVGALRNFSRLAEAEMKAVNIHEGLDSTLTILQNRLKASGKHPEIQVIKEYGTLPKVECYAGQLNQVFMNLLTNAIDAIDEQNQKRAIEDIQANPSIIRVRTEVLDNQQVAIRIADNGPGMTEQVKARLFDPFFTTKPVGAGTGLGLSISYQIVVKKHRGQLLCFSELGQGTDFVIQIPLSQPVSEK